MGIEVARSPQGIVLNQRKYVLDLSSDMGLSCAKGRVVPLSIKKDRESKKDEDLEKPGEFHRIIGRLIHLTLTRPDIRFSFQSLSHHMSSPKKSHWQAVVKFVKYLKQHPGLGLFMAADSELKLNCHYDSDWGTCSVSRRYVLGYLVRLGDSLISWKSKKTKCCFKVICRGRVLGYGKCCFITGLGYRNVR